jgi:hypothetical protein
MNLKPGYSFNLIFLLAAASLISGCANPQTKAWNHYETGMLLVFNGYDPSRDREDQVEKHFLKALSFNPFLPGVNASMGTYKAQKGDAQSATAYFEQEVKQHPEAAEAMALILDKDRLNQVKKNADKKDKEQKEKEKEEKKQKEKEEKEGKEEKSGSSQEKQEAPAAVSEKQEKTTNE